MYTMEQKRTPRNKKLIALVTVGPLLLALVSGFIAYKNLQAEITPQESKPLFTFEESKAPGLWAADNWHGSSGAEASDESTITGRNFFTGTREQPGTCFVMYFYKKGSVDVASAIEKIANESANKDAGESMQKLGTLNYAMQTIDGTKEFELHQFNLVGGSANQTASGIEVGFIPLSEGYIEIRGNCENAEQLEQTLPVFEAVGLKK